MRIISWSGKEIGSPCIRIGVHNNYPYEKVYEKSPNPFYKDFASLIFQKWMSPNAFVRSSLSVKQKFLSYDIMLILVDLFSYNYVSSTLF